MKFSQSLVSRSISTQSEIKDSLAFSSAIMNPSGTPSYEDFSEKLHDFSPDTFDHTLHNVLAKNRSFHHANDVAVELPQQAIDDLSIDEQSIDNDLDSIEMGGM